jgi:TetR/AcrR family transcriptional regulator, transcriptional repressor for nem operon
MMDARSKQSLPEVQSGAQPTKGERTRQRLLDLAQETIIEKGFNATSIEELVEAAGITKGGFFYHFRDKQDLSRQLVERWVADDTATWDALERRARELTDDPLQSFLIFIKLFAETMDDLPAVHPGCLVAAITYQARAFDPEVKRLSAEGLIFWRLRFKSWLDEVAALYPPRVPIDLDALADHLNVLADGGIVTSRIYEDKAFVGRQARMFHDLVRALFQPIVPNGA